MMELEKILLLIKENRIEEFYNDRSWRRTAHEVLNEYHNECQLCKSRGRYKRARYVHHVMHLKKHPELAYSKTYIDQNGKEQINLLPLCFDCHEEQHQDRFDKNKGKCALNEERW